jgi:superfamily I DNA and/or RNA helicase
MERQGFAPKILVIEEAGQVLEAHVLSTLFPSIQHVIAIGDPLQLRPTVNCYGKLTMGEYSSWLTIYRSINRK